MPRVKLAEIVDSDPEDSSNSLGTDSSVNDMDDVPEEYAMGFSESIPQPWVKPSNKRATFVDPPLMKKPFLDPPSSGLLLGMDKTMKPAFDSSDCRVLGEFVEKPSYQWVFTVLFEEGGSFVRRLELAGVAEAIRTSAGLGVQRNGSDMNVVVLLQLPVFGSVDLTLLHPDSDLLKLARHLQMSFSDAGRYAKELSKSRQAKKSSSKDEHPKTRQSSRGEEVVGDKQDSKKKKITVKYSYSNWPRYFFGDFLNGEFVPAPAVSSDLREAAFVAYWLSKYVFLGPVDECVSHGVFLLACLISRGERLPLAPMYLDSLYTRLDQFSQQLKIAHGRFPVLSFIDEIFLQLFLFERFSLFTPTRKPPTILPDKKASPRAWIWGSAHPSKSLEDVINLEKNFCFRPYVTSYQPDASAIHRIYSACLEHDRSDISTGQDGVYDFWLLCTSPTPLPGLIVMDRDFHCGALICPVIYRPDRVLFQEELSKYNPFSVVPFDRDGGVTTEYVDYLMRMKEHIRQYEGTSVPDVRSFVPVLIKDPYFMTGNLSPSTITNLNARCYRHPPSSKRKHDDSVVTAEVVKRSKVESSKVEVAKRSLERPPGPSVDAMPSPISTGSGISPSSTAKAKGSSAAACFVESSQSPGKAVVSLSSSVVKRRSHRLLGKLKTIPNAPSDPINVGDESSLERVSGDSPNSFIVGDVPDEGTTQEVVRDGLRARASSKRNVDIELGVTCQGDPTRRVVTPTRTVLPGAASSTSKITKELLASASSVFFRDEFEYFNGDAKNLLSEIVSRAPSFLLPNDLNCLFKKLGYQAFLDAWDFFTSHSLADLWGAHQDMPPPGISDLAREELFSKEHHVLSSDVSALQEKVNKLTSELNTMKARLASVSMEREQLAKHKEAASSVISYSDILWL
ncbi:PMD domain-containing protein [Arachis hypogaea]|uniref:PMD domain-containing protein n=1 Tax=Arachis hypogaea TaxID=3818 RepID=A0A6B9VBQ6_ARAHY|nr:PMD domain-containing protein [Arachis hypogaea]